MVSPPMSQKGSARPSIIPCSAPSSIADSPALVEIEANDDEWEYAPGKKSSANGDLGSTLRPQDAILPSAPVGALIAKVGGSRAGTTDGRLFVVGKKALLQLDQNTSGPLFLTINDQLSGLQNNDKSIKVRISIVYVPQVSSAARVAPIQTRDPQQGLQG